MEFDEALDRVSTGTVVIGIGFVIGAVLEYGVKVVLARFLGPETYGVFVQGIAVVEVVGVVGLLGLQRGLPRFIAYFRGKEDDEGAESAILTSVAISVVGGTLAAVGLYLSSGVLALDIFHEPSLGPVLRLFAFAVLPLGLFYLVVGMIRGVQSAKYKIYLTDVLLPVTQLGLILFFFWRGFGLNGAVYAYLVALLVTIGAGIYYFRSVSDYAFDAASLIPRKLIAFSWPLMVVSIVLAVNRWIDVLMLGWMTESARVGVYEVAMAVASVSVIFLNSLNYMYMPVLSEIYAAGDMPLVRQIYRTTTRWVYTLALPLLAGMLIFPSEILALLFGTGYTAGAAVLAVLAIGHFFSSSVGPAGTTLMAIGRPRLFMLGMIVLGAADIVLNLLLIPRYGILGAAVAMTTALILANAVMVGFVRAVAGTQPFTKKFIRPMVAMVATAIPAYLVARTINPPIAFDIVIGAVMTAAYLALVIMFGGIEDEDREMLQRLMGRAQTFR